MRVRVIARAGVRLRVRLRVRACACVRGRACARVECARVCIQKNMNKYKNTVTDECDG